VDKLGNRFCPIFVVEFCISHIFCNSLGGLRRIVRTWLEQLGLSAQGRIVFCPTLNADIRSGAVGLIMSIRLAPRALDNMIFL